MLACGSGLAGSDWLFTRANGIADLYRWLPWVSRRIAFDRPNHGDPFETPTSSSVRVRIVTDRRLVLATTGDRVSVSADGLTQVFEAEQVRDFTVTAATDFRIVSRVVGDTTVRAWFRPGTNGPALLDAAADAFEALQDRLGPLGFDTFKVVQSAGGYGMESPRLIWIPTGTTANLRYLVAHETAHQWFYGIVGNDQAIRAVRGRGRRRLRRPIGRGRTTGQPLPDGSAGSHHLPLLGRCYYETIYIQGGNLLEAARRRMGSTAFWAAL